MPRPKAKIVKINHVEVPVSKTGVTNLYRTMCRDKKNIEEDYKEQLAFVRKKHKKRLLGLKKAIRRAKKWKSIYLGIAMGSILAHLAILIYLSL